MTISTCKQAVDAWNSGATLTSVNISGMGPGYELGCQRLMFAAIEQNLDHEGDAEHWDSLVGSSPDGIFTNAKTIADDEGMTGAMWSYSMNAAVVMLRNGWARGIEMAPADRLFEVKNQTPKTSDDADMSINQWEPQPNPLLR